MANGFIVLLSGMKAHHESCFEPAIDTFVVGIAEPKRVTTPFIVVPIARFMYCDSGMGNHIECRRATKAVRHLDGVGCVGSTDSLPSPSCTIRCGDRVTAAEGAASSIRSISLSRIVSSDCCAVLKSSLLRSSVDFCADAIAPACTCLSTII